MIGSSTPGISGEVLRADMAARQRQAEQRREITRMRRELRAAQAEARRELRAAGIAVPRRLSTGLPRPRTSGLWRRLVARRPEGQAHAPL